MRVKFPLSRTFSCAGPCVFVYSPGVDLCRNQGPGSTEIYGFYGHPVPPLEGFFRAFVGVILGLHKTTLIAETFKESALVKNAKRISPRLFECLLSCVKMTKRQIIAFVGKDL